MGSACALHAHHPARTVGLLLFKKVRVGEDAIASTRGRVRSPKIQTRAVFISSSRINCIRFRSLGLERSFAIER
jgi:hypothetical protein